MQDDFPAGVSHARLKGWISRKRPSVGIELWWRPTPAAKTRRRGWAPVFCIEAEAGLQGYGAGPEGGGGLSEVTGLDVIGDAAAVAGAAGFEVEVVEDVEGIGANFEGSSLTQAPDSSQAEALGQGSVDVAIAGPGEEVPADAGPFRNKCAIGVEVGAGGDGGRNEVGEAAIGEVSVGAAAHAGARFVGIVAGIVACASEVGGRQHPGVAAGGAIEATHRADIDGVPGEAGVEVQDSADRPAAYKPLQHIVLAAEEHGLPQAVDLLLAADVVIGVPPIEAGIERIELFRVGG